MDASYQELWGPAALARAARNDLETPLENELGLLRAMRKRCGPFASRGKMVTHLRSARGKLHWSVNGYFRETVLDAGGSVDFAPPRVASLQSISFLFAPESRSIRPPAIWPKPFPFPAL